jgi:hypothetical protein
MLELSSVIIGLDRIDADRSSIVLVVEDNEVAALQMSTVLEELVTAFPPVTVIHPSPEKLRLDRGIVEQPAQNGSGIRALSGQSHQSKRARDAVEERVMMQDSWWARSEIDA